MLLSLYNCRPYINPNPGLGMYRLQFSSHAYFQCFLFLCINHLTKVLTWKLRDNYLWISRNERYLCNLILPTAHYILLPFLTISVHFYRITVLIMYDIQTSTKVTSVRVRYVNWTLSVTSRLNSTLNYAVQYSWIVNGKCFLTIWRFSSWKENGKHNMLNCKTVYRVSQKKYTCF